ncbi:hypothetical protein GO495_17650 [Chitinophaga oryziterrae]|uniref:Uncharacterized protein n=1 Tax=Chitinophaga oryziterrae TaxID=1031224 RepID=A0A6N8JE70_9BACT|nr:hypothetical protein [Chitinophaga oryziterrae]MVT42422.1 hypothetical protein [Chitinophaga oryziterrae]
MIVSTRRIPLYDYTAGSGKEKRAFIDIANENKGGESTWEDGSSIRKTVIDVESGKFDLPSSHELPTSDISQMVQEGANDDVFTRDECIAMIDALTASMQRIP